MNAPPKGWPRVAAAVYYDDPHAAIDWLTEAFGFELRLKVEGDGGVINYCEMTYGEGLFMVSDTRRQDEGHTGGVSPRNINGGNTVRLCVVVDDVDAHAAQAKAAGAEIAMAPTTTDYGDDYWTDRTYEAVDPEGHHWWFLQRIKG